MTTALTMSDDNKFPKQDVNWHAICEPLDWQAQLKRYIRSKSFYKRPALNDPYFGFLRDCIVANAAIYHPESGSQLCISAVLENAAKQCLDGDIDRNKVTLWMPLKSDEEDFDSDILVCMPFITEDRLETTQTENFQTNQKTKRSLTEDYTKRINILKNKQIEHEIEIQDLRRKGSQLEEDRKQEHCWRVLAEAKASDLEKSLQNSLQRNNISPKSIYRGVFEREIKELKTQLQYEQYRCFDFAQKLEDEQWRRRQDREAGQRDLLVDLKHQRQQDAGKAQQEIDSDLGRQLQREESQQKQDTDAFQRDQLEANLEHKKQLEEVEKRSESKWLQERKKWSNLQMKLLAEIYALKSSISQLEGGQRLLEKEYHRPPGENYRSTEHLLNLKSRENEFEQYGESYENVRNLYSEYTKKNDASPKVMMISILILCLLGTLFFWYWFVCTTICAGIMIYIGPHHPIITIVRKRLYSVYVAYPIQILISFFLFYLSIGMVLLKPCSIHVPIFMGVIAGILGFWLPSPLYANGERSLSQKPEKLN